MTPRPRPRQSPDGPTVDPRPYLPAAMPSRDPAGPEAGQRARGRFGLVVAMLSTGNAEHRQGLPVRIFRGQAIVSPQQMPPAVQLQNVVNSAAVGVHFVNPHVPQRVAAAGWDGEPGAQSPHPQA